MTDESKSREVHINGDILFKEINDFNRKEIGKD